MGYIKSTRFNNSEIIRASEIGQYHYCPVSWYLQKCGYEPKSPDLEIGKKKHIELGSTIDGINLKYKRNRNFTIIGYLCLLLSALIFFYEVVL